MAPGNRADWLVRCPEGTHTFESVAGAGRRLQGKGKGGGMAGGGNGNAGVTQTLASVTVTEQGDTLSDLPCFEVNRPCYLVDLTSATPSSTTTIGLGPVPNINGNAFTSSATYDHTLAVGQVHQFDLNGVDAHPFHLVRARPRDATNLCLTAPRL